LSWIELVKCFELRAESTPTQTQLIFNYRATLPRVRLARTRIESELNHESKFFLCSPTNIRSQKNWKWKDTLCANNKSRPLSCFSFYKWCIRSSVLKFCNIFWVYFSQNPELLKMKIQSKLEDCILALHIINLIKLWNIVVQAFLTCFWI
jgi:hypothetical protein